jgi:hypothetical protein
MKWLSTNRCIGQSYESIFTEIEENLTFMSTQAYKWGVSIDILFPLDSASLLVNLKPRIFQRLPPSA